MSRAKQAYNTCTGLFRWVCKLPAGLVGDLGTQSRESGPCLPASEELAPRRCAYGLDVIVLQLDTLSCQPVQRWGLDI